MNINMTGMVRVTLKKLEVNLQRESDKDGRAVMVPAGGERGHLNMMSNLHVATEITSVLPNWRLKSIFKTSQLVELNFRQKLSSPSNKSSLSMSSGCTCFYEDPEIQFTP